MDTILSGEFDKDEHDAERQDRRQPDQDSGGGSVLARRIVIAHA